eukprot:TRINITY_DN1241_c0_g1_i1.p1 TRINITY_DN1241_c0_g1~~TRINITY_DN1241_c0_g1_i1.p1  ORF type:complete len:845 (-),score=251.07 TRINITY_DN1241_c0_g1_i1:109-2643(-)
MRRWDQLDSKVSAYLPVLTTDKRPILQALGRPPQAADCGVVVLPPLSAREQDAAASAPPQAEPGASAAEEGRAPERSRCEAGQRDDDLPPGRAHHPLARRNPRRRRFGKRATSRCGQAPSPLPPPAGAPNERLSQADLSQLSTLMYGLDERDQLKMIWRTGHTTAFLQGLQQERDDAALKRRDVARGAGEAQRKMARELRQRQEEELQAARRAALERARELLEEKAESEEQAAEEADESRQVSKEHSGRSVRVMDSFGQIIFEDTNLNDGEEDTLLTQRDEETTDDAETRLRRRAARAVVGMSIRLARASSGNFDVTQEDSEAFEANDSGEDVASSVPKTTVTRSRGLKKMVRLGRLLHRRRKEFQAKSEDERRQLTNAFELAAGSIKGTLDAKDLRTALRELGLYAKTNEETKALKMITMEANVLGTDFFNFVFEVVPRARQRLRELRHGPLLQSFLLNDTDKSGSIDRDECIRILDKQFLWRLDVVGRDMMLARVGTIFDALVVPGTDGVEFEGYEELCTHCHELFNCVQLSRERAIIHEQNLSDHDIAVHSDEIAYLFGMFALYLTPNSEGMSSTVVESLRRCLVETGLIVKDLECMRFLAEMYDDAKKDELGFINFGSFLQIVRQMRAWIKHQNRAYQYEVFKSLDADNSGQLSVAEISAVAAQFGLTPRCRDEQDLLKRLLDNADFDGDGEFNFSEFQVILQLMGERLRAIQCYQEQIVAESLNFSRQELSELRNIFFLLDEDGDNFLTASEVRKAVETIRCPLRGKKLPDLIAAFSPTANGLTFEKFLHFLRLLIPPAHMQNMPPHARRRERMAQQAAPAESEDEPCGAASPRRGAVF